MGKEDIKGGIKNAMSRGSTLKEAMQSFYNAGYKKEDIEQAARELQSSGGLSLYSQVTQSQPIQQVQQSSLTSSTQTLQNPPAISIREQPLSQPVSQASPQMKQLSQKIIPKQTSSSSSYIGWIILLIGLFIITITTAAILIFFQPQLSQFINSFVK